MAEFERGDFQLIDMAYDGAGLDNRLLADFNGDGLTDAWTRDAQTQPINQYVWYISYGGVNNYQLVNTDLIASEYVHVGDFNGDGKADILTAQRVNNTAVYQWYYSNAAVAAPLRWPRRRSTHCICAWPT